MLFKGFKFFVLKIKHRGVNIIRDGSNLIYVKICHFPLTSMHGEGVNTIIVVNWKTGIWH